MLVSCFLQNTINGEESKIKDTYSKLDKVICVSKQAKKIFCEKYNIDKKKIEVIYNFINEGRFIPESSPYYKKIDILDEQIQKTE